MNIPAGALDGLRVIDLTRVLGGPYCTQMLGDHGADILKIEPPGGDETRTWGPPFHNGLSAYFLGANRNKRSIVLDLTQPDGHAKLLKLLVDADVMVENFKPGTLEKWGLGYKEVLAEQFPRLIHCCVSGFGADGPMGGLPGYDAAIQAMCGLMSINGDPAGEPIRIGVPIVDMVAGLNAAIGILLALQERARSGKGQSIDITLHDSAISVLHPHTPNYLYSGRVPQRSGNAHPNISPYDTYKTRTTPIFLAVETTDNSRSSSRYLASPGLLKIPASRQISIASMPAKNSSMSWRNCLCNGIAMNSRRNLSATAYPAGRYAAWIKCWRIHTPHIGACWSRSANTAASGRQSK